MKEPRNEPKTNYEFDYKLIPIQDKKGRYPRSVFFIIGNEFCERFSYYGMRAALTLFASEILLYNNTDATILFHSFTMLSYFFPIFGAIISDSFLGKYKTILYFSIIYAVGQMALSASAVGPFQLPTREFAVIGLILIAIGAGGIKPCVLAFGGDQFELPKQEAYLTAFVSVFYFSIYVGALLTTFITPILRKDVTCFEEDSCYSLAFLLPFILMNASIVCFVAGKRFYAIKKPTENMLNVVKCITYGISKKMKSTTKRDYWLDHADDKYDKEMINDVKRTFRLLILYIPTPFFWTLYDQQGSTWIFQATSMNGELFGYLLKPDQTLIVQPFVVLILIPIFQIIINPVLEKIYISTPLRKITVGGFLAAVAFFVSAMLELKLEPTYAVLSSPGLAQVRIFNTLNCSVPISVNGKNHEIEGLAMWSDVNVATINGTAKLDFKADFQKCKDAGYLVDARNISVPLQTPENNATSWAISNGKLIYNFTSRVEKSKSGNPSIELLVYKASDSKNNLTLNFLNKNIVKHSVTLNETLKAYKLFELGHNEYNVEVNNRTLLKDVKFSVGGVYTIVAYVSNNETSAKIITITPPNSVHVLWLLPQIIVMAIAEIMFNITGYEFSYSQAPKTMKSFLQACWLLTMAVGNLFVVFIEKVYFFERRVYDILLFGGLMVIDMLIFVWMAVSYKYVVESNEINKIDSEKNSGKSSLSN